MPKWDRLQPGFSITHQVQHEDEKQVLRRAWICRHRRYCAASSPGKGIPESLPDSIKSRVSRDSLLDGVAVYVYV